MHLLGCRVYRCDQSQILVGVRTYCVYHWLRTYITAHIDFNRRNRVGYTVYVQYTPQKLQGKDVLFCVYTISKLWSSVCLPYLKFSEEFCYLETDSQKKLAFVYKHMHQMFEHNNLVSVKSNAFCTQAIFINWAMNPLRKKIKTFVS